MSYARMFKNCNRKLVNHKELTRICFGGDIYLLFRIVYLGGCVLYILLFQVFCLNTRSTFLC